jgi:chromosome segregation ATPase
MKKSVYNYTMDERRNKIRDLEAKKASDNTARNQLLTGLGEALFRRIGEGEPFTNDAGNIPSGVLEEYRKLHKEIDEARELIKILEKEVLRLKELEETIFAREGEKSRLEKELEDVYAELGKSLLEDPGFSDATGNLKQQEQTILERISEHEAKLEELEKREGGIFAWLGKNAQMTVSKTILVKNRATLNQLYRVTGDKYITTKPVDTLDGENTLTVGKALELRELLSSLAAELTTLKGERRKAGELFGAEGSPSRRINGLEKHISHVEGKFPDVYLRMGSLTAEAEGKALLSSFLTEADVPVLEKTGFLKSQITQSEMEIEKIRTAINIDNEKAAIEKIKKSISAQRQKITAAEELITGFEKQIAETEQRIEELQSILNNSAGT